ncbi:MAG: alpha/beta fold hydrolase [Eubacterium sp.]|nr:alpha/beta fold hydrolase [Eubacterium sp.]
MEVLKIVNGNCTIYGNLFRPKEQGPRPAIIMCHGYNGIADDFLEESKYYAEHGYISYSFDFCGGSNRCRSTGRKSTEMTLFTEKSDLMAVFDHISQMEEVDSNRVYLMGGSQGGLVSALCAEELQERIRAMALYFPALCIPDNWRKAYPDSSEIPEEDNFWDMRLSKNFFLAMKDLYVFDSIGKFRNPVYILQGDQDVVVRPSDSQRAVDLYPNAKLKVMEGETHGFSEEGKRFAMEEVLKFMEENK